MSTHSFPPARGGSSSRPDVRIKGRGGYTVVDGRVRSRTAGIEYHAFDPAAL